MEAASPGTTTSTVKIEDEEEEEIEIVYDKLGDAWRELCESHRTVAHQQRRPPASEATEAASTTTAPEAAGEASEEAAPGAAPSSSSSEVAAPSESSPMDAVVEGAEEGASTPAAVTSVLVPAEPHPYPEDQDFWLCRLASNECPRGCGPITRRLGDQRCLPASEAEEAATTPEAASTTTTPEAAEEASEEATGAPSSSSEVAAPSESSQMDAVVEGAEEKRASEGDEIQVMHDKLLDCRGEAPLPPTPATVTSVLVPAEPHPYPEDQDFWLCHLASNECPRGCGPITRRLGDRQLHYRKYHYNIYYAAMGTRTAANDALMWAHANLGDAFASPRVCVLCPRLAYHRGRTALARHIREMHPTDFAQLVLEYGILSEGTQGRPIERARERGVRGVDLEVHRLLRSEKCISRTWPKDPTTSSSQNVIRRRPPRHPSTPATPYADAAAAGAASLPLDAPPSEVDDEYYNGHPPLAVCPRGCYFFASVTSSRRRHYRQHHYNIYFAVRNLAKCRLYEWLLARLGMNGKEGRVCLSCEGDERKWAGYETRAELLRHIMTGHPLAFSQLAMEYGSKATGGSVQDQEVHDLMQQALCCTVVTLCAAPNSTKCEK